MKKRYDYMLLFAIPSLVFALITMTLVAAGASGVMWLFVFGDEPWPPAARSPLVPALLLAGGIALWVGLLWLASLSGKAEEPHPHWNRGHVLLAVSATLLMVLAVIVQQRSVGNIGPKPDIDACGDFCLSRGFAACSMPPRISNDATCSCLDAHGGTALEAPMARIRGGN